MRCVIKKLSLLGLLAVSLSAQGITITVHNSTKHQTTITKSCTIPGNATTPLTVDVNRNETQTITLEPTCSLANITFNFTWGGTGSIDLSSLQSNDGDTYEIAKGKDGLSPFIDTSNGSISFKDANAQAKADQKSAALQAQATATEAAKTPQQRLEEQLSPLLKTLQYLTVDHSLAYDPNNEQTNEALYEKMAKFISLEAGRTADSTAQQIVTQARSVENLLDQLGVKKPVTAAAPADQPASVPMPTFSDNADEKLCYGSCKIAGTTLKCLCNNYKKKTNEKVELDLNQCKLQGTSQIRAVQYNPDYGLRCYEAPEKVLTAQEKLQLFLHTPPPGPYTASCQDCKRDGATLSCNCKDATSKFVPTTIGANGCADNSIFNENGQLKCLPLGSYNDSCQDCKIEKSILSCNCKSPGTHVEAGTNRVLNDYVPSKINIDDCAPFSVTNDNGSLTCLPAGSYLDSCKNCKIGGTTIVLSLDPTHNNYNYIYEENALVASGSPTAPSSQHNITLTNKVADKTLKMYGSGKNMEIKVETECPNPKGGTITKNYTIAVNDSMTFQACNNQIKVTTGGNILSCNCPGTQPNIKTIKDGGLWPTTIDADMCKKNTISNDKGRLNCEHLLFAKAPEGSYAKSCHNCKTKDGILSCSCSGKFSGTTSIDTTTCKTTFSNDDGVLTCDDPLLPGQAKAYIRPTEDELRKACYDPCYQKDVSTCYVNVKDRNSQDRCLSALGNKCEASCKTVATSSDKVCPAVCSKKGYTYCPGNQFGDYLCGCYAAGSECPTSKPEPEAKGCLDSNQAIPAIEFLRTSCPAICLNAGMQYCPDQACNGKGQCGCYTLAKGCPAAPDQSPQYVGCSPIIKDKKGQFSLGQACRVQGLMQCSEAEQAAKCSCSEFDEDGDCVEGKEVASVACFKYDCPPLTAAQKAPMAAADYLRIFSTKMKISNKTTGNIYNFLSNLLRYGLSNDPQTTNEVKAQIFDVYAIKLGDYFGTAKKITSDPNNEVEEITFYFETAKKMGVPQETVIQFLIEHIFPQATTERRTRLLAALSYELKNINGVLLQPTYAFINPTQTKLNLVIGETSCFKEETASVEPSQTAMFQSNGCPLQTITIKNDKGTPLASKKYKLPIEKNGIWTIQKNKDWAAWDSLTPQEQDAKTKKDPAAVKKLYTTDVYDLIDYNTKPEPQSSTATKK